MARGNLFACNYAPGICFANGVPTSRVCRHSDDCAASETCQTVICDPTCSPGVVEEVAQGVGVDVAFHRGAALPAVDLGDTADAGRNVLVHNMNPSSRALPKPGVNLSSRVLSSTSSTTLFSATTTTSTSAPTTTTHVSARGNQWEHCAGGCTEQDLQADIRVDAGAMPVDAGDPGSAREGPAPAIVAISPPRPKAGEFVRVYGGPFNAVDGTDCYPSGVPADSCSPENPSIVAKNHQDAAYGQRVTIRIGNQVYDADVHSVTPSMLIFAMPIDCLAAGTLTVTRGASEGPASIICSPQDCRDQPAQSPCDDGNPCTADDTCDEFGACIGTAFANPSTICRAARDECDSAETCTGSSGECPTDARIPGCFTTTTMPPPASTTTITTTSTTITDTTTTITCVTARCLVGAAISSPACVAEVVPRAIQNKLNRAAILIDKVPGSRRRKARHRLGRASVLLSQVRRAARKATEREPARLSGECATEIEHVAIALQGKE